MHKLFRFLVWVVLIVGAVVGLARATVIRWWWVPSDDPFLTASISPTLRAGDLILLWRGTKPGFGDLVMCPEPKDPSNVVIGRIIGEERDELSITKDLLTYNGKHPSDEGQCSESKFTETDPGTKIEVEQRCRLEDVGGTVHMRGQQLSTSILPNDVKTTVPEGQVWLVSDNRQFPYDSRDYGPVPRETCTETVFFRLVSAGGYFDTESRNTFIR